MKLPATDRIKELVGLVRRLALVPDRKSVQVELKNIRIEDLSEAISRVDPEEAAKVLRDMDPLKAGEILVEVPTETARKITDFLPDDIVAAYLDVLPMDDALDLREELGEERFEALLQVIPDEDAREIRRLLAFPEESVGRLLTEKYFDVKPYQTMAQILTDLRLAPDEKYETVNSIYVVDEDRKLVGITSLRSVLRVDPATRVEEVMQTDLVVSLVYENEETAARKMSRYGFYALPVVDHEGRMLGIFTGDDAQEILRQADTEDVLAVAGVSGDAEPYMSLNVFQLFKRRVPWLLALFVAETFTGQVMRHYGQVTEGLSLAPLTFFIPLLIGAGGNSGSQVTTTITRAVALDEVKISDVWAVLGKELMTAILVGGTLGFLGFLRAGLPLPFGWDSGPGLSLVVGLALPAIVIWAATVGSVLPIAAKKMGIDPAVMSAPFITTFVDATGLIIYFEIALRFLNP